MKSCSNQKSVKQFFKVATFAMVTALHTLVTWNAFPSLEGVPTYAEHLLAAIPSLCGPTHPKQSQLG